MRARAQHFKHGHHAHEDAEKELGDFNNRRKGELIGNACGLGRGHERQDGDHEEEHVAHDALQRELNGEHVEGDARIPDAAHQHRADDAKRRRLSKQLHF